MNYAPNALFDLSGRTALVTGASRGIGAAIAQGLAAAGAHVFAHGQTERSAAATVTAITEAGGSAEAIFGDLAERSMGSALIRSCEARAGKLDILVINASAQINAPLDQLTDADLSFQIDVNLRATVDMLRGALPLMAAQGWGRVVNIGSINQSGPKPVVTAYAATKAAQHNLVQSQAREYAQTGVTLNTLSPGLIDTDRNADRKATDPEGWQAYVAQANWMGRAGTADEMVGAAVFLASDASRFMTGEVLTLSGGY
ncbi:Gluconate 5-dehydrogenase [Tritonibacter multivorans]|uniref:Gluconate 5-dehydrogenase n=1 Tax=Tritonibacter multivorans TaxID=928856 RepID=A0A0P1GRF7_9RHOB|nr:SDR family oxidoreductase [Tritonibacter multivorans]MDA7421875.1 SDR family NAD(P)-dependent oxidoreductase [Tritonibacter multivorans]CUH76682.1 Gluconate 5-dehydrogenase [Tritonibacter multivorans]SFD49257.1 NAD(P)-dependent dehydrogenase, short-chain alcohol dehydrogenase family [Tritonibacter multivorans]